MKHRLICIALAGLAPVAAYSAAVTPEVLVSASRTDEPDIDIPAGYATIEREQIESSGAENLSQLLRSMPGITVADGVGGGGSATLDMRGFGSSAASNVAVLVDGQKLNPATDASTLYLNSIDLDRVERIEIIEGSAGTLYGNQAVGGLINIITRRSERREALLRGGIGSYASRELMADLNAPLQGGPVLNMHARRFRSDNYRRHNDSDVKQVSLSLSLPHQGGDTRIQVSHLDDYQDTPGALLASEIAVDRRQVTSDYVNDYFHTRSTDLRLSGGHAVDSRWRAEGDMSLRRDRRDFIQSFRGFGPGSRATQDRDTLAFNPRLIGSLDALTLTLGADIQRTDYLLVSAFGPQGNDQLISAAYAQAHYRLSTDLSVTGGLRHARVTNDINNNGSPVQIDDDVTVGSLGGVYRAMPGLRLYARADQNYRFPKVDEHTNPVFGQPVGLKTQTGVSYETGLDYLRPAYSLRVRLYRLNLKNEISNDASAFLANVNLDHTRRIGAALSADMDIGANWRIGGGYEYIDSEITSGTHAGSQVPMVAPHHATLFAEWQATPQMRVRADLEYIGERVLASDFANTAPRLGAHTTVDLNLHYDKGDWRLNARINNLFNALYNESGASAFGVIGFNPAPERNAMLTATYLF